MLLCDHPWRPCVYKVSLHLISKGVFVRLQAKTRRYQKLYFRIQIVQIGLKSPLSSFIEASPLASICLTHLHYAAAFVAFDIYRSDQADLPRRQTLEEDKPQYKPLAQKPSGQIHFCQKVFTVIRL